MQHRTPSFGPRGEVCPVASPEVLHNAKEQAAVAEAAGREAARRSGQAPKGPPNLPTGVVVVEQKYVDFLIGPGGQSLASINYAAGVNVHLDQSNKFSGYTIANIFGNEEAAERAKVAIDFKISQWLPRGMSYGAVGPGSYAPAPLHTSGPSHTAVSSRPQPKAFVGSADGSAAYDPTVGSEALSDPLVKALAKWPSLARSAARATAAGRL